MMNKETIEKACEIIKNHTKDAVIPKKKPVK